MPDIDLYVGTGSTPSLATEVCVSASGGSLEHCDIPDPEAGTWWVLDPELGGERRRSRHLHRGDRRSCPATDLGNAGVDGPDGPVPTGEPYDIRFHWDIPEMEAGDVWYGTAVLGTSPATAGRHRLVPGDAPPGGRRRHQDGVGRPRPRPATRSPTTITIQPNVTPEDLVYTIVDTVPGRADDRSGVGDRRRRRRRPDDHVGGRRARARSHQPSSATSPRPRPPTPQCAEWGGFVDLGAAGHPVRRRSTATPSPPPRSATSGRSSSSADRSRTSSSPRTGW